MVPLQIIYSCGVWFVHCSAIYIHIYIYIYIWVRVIKLILTGKKEKYNGRRYNRHVSNAKLKKLSMQEDPY